MVKKILIMLLLLSSIVSAQTETLDLRSSCVSEPITVKIRGDKPIQENEYRFDNCTRTRSDAWQWWSCPCTGQKEVIFVFDERAGNVYDIVTKHYIDKLEVVEEKAKTQYAPTATEIRNDQKKRTNTFSDITFVSQPKNESTKSFVEKISIEKMGVVVGGVLITTFFLVTTFIFWLIRNLEKKRVVARRGPPQGFKQLSSEEKEKYMKKYL